jgi:hypothetical protein
MNPFGFRTWNLYSYEYQDWVCDPRFISKVTNALVQKSLEKCRLLGYKNPGRTSQETHYVSATEIWGFRGGDYEECRLLGYKKPFHI